MISQEGTIRATDACFGLPTTADVTPNNVYAPA